MKLQFSVLWFVFILMAPELPLLAESTLLRFASGPEGGTYHAVVTRAVERLRTSTGDSIPRIEVVSTEGSVENLKLLAATEVDPATLGADFALAQQDVVVDELRRVPRGASVPFVVVDRIFFDYLHILVRDPLRVETAGDFRHLRVWPGNENSGTRVTARWLLESLGIPFWSLRIGLLQQGALTLDEVHERLAGQELDVAMLLIAAGDPELCRRMGDGNYSLFPLDYRTRRTLIEETEEAEEARNGAGALQAVHRRQIALATIPAGTYRQPEPVPTIAVPVLLLARQHGADTEILRRAVHEAWREIQASAATGRHVTQPPPCHIPSIEPEAEPLSASGLPGVKRTGNRWQPAARRGVIGGLAVAFSLLLWSLRRQLKDLLRGTRRLLEGQLAVVLTVSFGVGIFLIALVTYLVERPLNEHFSTPDEAFWSITVYLFSGLEDRTPYTMTGRVTAALGLLLGPLLFATATGWLARFFIHWEKHMPGNLKNHYLILNWNERGQRVVRQLHHPIITARNGTEVVVVLTDDDTLDLEQLKKSGVGHDEIFEDFFLSVGDPTSERALLNANAQDAKTVLILAREDLGNGADERTIRSLVMLRRIARVKEIAHLHVVAELIEPANNEVVDEIARDFPGLVERISGLEVETCLLAQATLSQGITGFYSDLLHVSAETNEVYIQPIPITAVGMGFREYAALVLQAHLNEPLIPLGVQRAINGRIATFPNPRPGQPGSVLEEGDRLVLLAYQPPPPDALPVP